MPVLSDLPDELILAIGHAVAHPPDALSLTRVCRRLNRLSTPLLYTNLTFDYESYLASPHFTDENRKFGVAQPYSAVTKLLQQFDDEEKGGVAQLSSTVRSLSLRVPCNTRLIHHGLSLLKDKMTGLIELRFEALSRDDVISEDSTPLLRGDYSSFQVHRMVDPSIFQDALRCTNHSLKKLVIYADYSWNSEYEDDSIGDFGKLEALQQLDIQGNLFAGWVISQQRDPKQCMERVNHLPPNLRTLHLRCYTEHLNWTDTLSVGKKALVFGVLAEINQTLKALEVYLQLPDRPQPLLEKIVIWLSEGMEDDGSMRSACWSACSDLMDEFERQLETVMDMASEQGIRFVGRVMDDLQVGVGRRLWHE